MGVSVPRDLLSLPTPQRILVRGVNWLGDAIMSTPALTRLRQRFPNSQISLLTPAKLADLWQNFPALDSVLTFSAGESPWAVGRRLPQIQADLALTFPNSPRSALELWIARIPERVGYARPWRNWFLTRALPSGTGRLLTHKRSISEIKNLVQPGGGLASRPAPVPVRHQLHEYLHLVAALGADPAPLAPAITVAHEETLAAAKKFGLPDSTTDFPFFGLNPGAEYGPAKRWPADHFVAAASCLQATTRGRWIIFGGPGDINLANRLANDISALPGNASVFNLAGKTTLRDLCALLKLCRVVLTNDTGPMHLAAAVGTPVVTPFGSTSAELTGPGLPGDPSQRHQLLQSAVPCSPCFRRQCPIDFRCMTSISPEAVAEAVRRAARL